MLMTTQESTQKYNPVEIIEHQIEECEKYLLNPDTATEVKKIIIPKLKLLKTVNLPISKQDELSSDDLIKAMNITCYGNLMYCCGLSKNCIWRDAARAALHMGDSLYTAKEKMIFDLAKQIKRVRTDDIGEQDKKINIYDTTPNAEKNAKDVITTEEFTCTQCGTLVKQNDYPFEDRNIYQALKEAGKCEKCARGT